MRRILPLLAAASLVLLAVPATSSAALFGVEANNDLANSNRLAQQPQTLDRMKGQGVGVIRVNMGWNEIAQDCLLQSPRDLRNHLHSCYNWSVFDSVVRQANDRGIHVLATVSRAPVWLHNSSNPSYVGQSGVEWSRTVQHYESFMRAAATRYRRGSSYGSVRMWTVWNEPNADRYFAPQRTRFMQTVMARRYAQLFGRTAVQIRAADKNVYIAAGPTGPTGGKYGTRPITFLAIVQRSLPAFLPGTGRYERRYINGWAHNPYPGFRTSPSRGRDRAPAVGMSNIRDLFRQLDRAPITRRLPVWATEFGWETSPPDRILGVSPATQGRFMGEAFDWLESTRRVPIIIWYGFRDGDNVHNDWQSGTWYANGRAKVSRLWFMRPISVPVSVTRRGSYVRVWARSTLNPRATRIAMSTNGRTWRLLPRIGRRADGTTAQNVRVWRKTWFATWDGRRGPARVVHVRR